MSAPLLTHETLRVWQALTCRLSADLEAVTINAPDWGVIRCGITAARLHQAADSQLTLKPSNLSV